MSWVNKTEEFFRFYAKDLAECKGIDITEEQLDDVINDIMVDDYLFDKIDEEISIIFNDNNIIEKSEEEE